MSEEMFNEFVRSGQVAQRAADALIEGAEWDGLRNESRKLKAESGNGEATDPGALARGPKRTRLICRVEVKAFLLEHAKATRAHKFTMVSEETLIAVNEACRAACVAIVRRLPSKGKTI
jgi:hypothetical protein